MARGFVLASNFLCFFGFPMRLHTKINKLKKRMFIESVIDQLKNICQLEHTRHRSVANFYVNIAAALIVYTYQGKKPALKLRGSQQVGDLLAHAF